MEQSDRRCFEKKYCWNKWDCCERVKGSVLNSDLCAPVPFIKALGDAFKWIPENSLKIKACLSSPR